MNDKEWNWFYKSYKSLLSYFASRILMDGKEWNEFYKFKINKILYSSYFASRVLMDGKEWNEFYKS